MQPLNTTVRCSASSVIGWAAPSLRSMISPRRRASATQPPPHHDPPPPPTAARPRPGPGRPSRPPSGRPPRRRTVPLRRRSRPRSRTSARRPLSFSAPRHDAGPEPPQQGGLVLVDALHEGPHAVVLRPHGVGPAAAQTGRPLPGRPHLLVGLLVAVLAVLLHVLV